MSRGPDAATRLERALLASASTAGVTAAIPSAEWTRWASATFTGARHEMRLTALPSAELDAWLAALPELEFELRDHLVADIAVMGARRTGESIEIEIEALTVEER